MHRTVSLAAAIAGAVLCAVSPGYAAIVPSGTQPAGTMMFATFDPPTPIDTRIATIQGGALCQAGFPPDSCNLATSVNGSTFLYANIGDAATIRFNGVVDYFGLEWGTLGSTDMIEFYRGTDRLASFRGLDFFAAGFPGGFKAENPQDYFDTIVLSNPFGCCFEVDNLTARTVSSAPSLEIASVRMISNNTVQISTRREFSALSGDVTVTMTINGQLITAV